MKKALIFLLAIAMLLSFAACHTAPAKKTPLPTPEATSEPTPSPAPEPTPELFSYENVFGEIFSDEALSVLYPGIEDYEKERTRISGNIARIEDFEFYELTAEQQEFIKQTQQGNTDESNEAELREVLSKIYEKDPYVFDDVDNEVKIDNRVNHILTDLKQVNIDASGPEYYDPIKESLIVCNYGNIENCHTDEERIIFDINVSTTVNENYFIRTVLPDYQNNTWKGNYSVFDSSQFLLDGSQGQKLYKKLIEANVKFYNSEKEDIKNSLTELVGECVNLLLVNDALQRPGGIGSLDSRMHYVVVYKYAYFLLVTPTNRMDINITCDVPDECVEQLGLRKNTLSLLDIAITMERCVGINSILYPAAYDELEQMQLEKYGNTVHIQRREEGEG